MPKINVLAVFNGQPLKTKAALKQLIETSADLVDFLPADKPTPLTEAVRLEGPTHLPAHVTVVAHSPTKRKWTAEVSRTHSGVFTVK